MFSSLPRILVQEKLTFQNYITVAFVADRRKE